MTAEITEDVASAFYSECYEAIRAISKKYWMSVNPLEAGRYLDDAIRLPAIAARRDKDAFKEAENLFRQTYKEYGLDKDDLWTCFLFRKHLYTLVGAQKEDLDNNAPPLVAINRWGEVFGFAARDVLEGRIEYLRDDVKMAPKAYASYIDALCRLDQVDKTAGKGVHAG